METPVSYEHCFQVETGVINFAIAHLDPWAAAEGAVQYQGTHPLGLLSPFSRFGLRIA